MFEVARVRSESSPPCCSPISWGPPTGLLNSEIAVGGIYSTATTRVCALR